MSRTRMLLAGIAAVSAIFGTTLLHNAASTSYNMPCGLISLGIAGIFIQFALPKNTNPLSIFLGTSFLIAGLVFLVVL